MAEPGKPEKSDGQKIVEGVTGLLNGLVSDEPAPKVEAGPEVADAAKIEAAKNAKDARVKELSGMKLEDLKGKIEAAKDAEILNELLVLKTLEGQKFEFTCEAPGGIFEPKIDDIKNALVKVFPATMKFEKIAKFLQIDEADVKEIMAVLLANNVKTAFEAKLLPKLAEYAATFAKEKALGKLTVGVVVGKDGTMEVNFDGKAADAAKPAEAEKPKAGADLVAGLGAMDLEAVKAQLGADADQFLSLTNLDGLAGASLAVDLSLVAASGGDFSAVKNAIFAKLDDKNIDKILALPKFKDVDKTQLKNAVRDMYGKHFETEVKKKFKDYPRMADFLKSDEGKKFATLKANGAFGPLSSLTFSFDDKEFKPAYDEYLKKNPTPLDADEIAQKAEDIKKSPIGKLLGFLGYGTAPVPPETQTGFEKIACGADPIGCFILGLFGYKGFTEAYEGVVCMMSPKMKMCVERAHKQAMESKLGEKGAAKAEEGKDGKEAPKYEVFNEEKFRKFAVSGKGMPENGFVLEKDFDLAAKGVGPLDVNFTQGGEIIIPKATAVNLDRQSFFDKDNERKLDDGVHKFEGTIPAGVVFKGKVTLLNWAPAAKKES